MIDKVMTTGVANWTPALPLLMERAGYREEAYFSVSHAPAEDDEGRVAGMLAVCSEVTAQVVGERRLKLLRDLAANAADLRSVEATCRDVAAAIASDPLDVPFALLYLMDVGGSTLSLRGTAGLRSGDPSAAPSIGANDVVPWPSAKVLAGETVMCDGIGQMLGLECGIWSDQVRSAVAMPLFGPGRSGPLGILVAGVSPNRALDDGYRSFFDLLAGQVSTSVRNARAHEEERRRADALAELDRAKTRFFSNVSHEFRTPLTLMLGPVEDVLARADLPEDVRGELTIAHRNALRLLRLVNTLLDFSRVEAGRAEASFEPSDLAALTSEIASTFRSAVEKAGVAFEVDCAPIAEPAYVDRDMWEKIVLNLVSNAFKHTFVGRIAVTLREDGDGMIRLKVVDTGVGIPAQELGRIFERFHRIEGTTSRTHEGSGIGLALVRELVALHGGAVSVESEEGRGTTFTVTIPVGSAHLPADRIAAPRRLAGTTTGSAPFVEEALRWSAAAPLPEPRAVPANVVTLRPASPLPAGSHPIWTGRARIVLADDNADMRAYVERLLAPYHDVEGVADGAAALAALRARPTDMLVTDVMMPVMDGIALVRAVRNDPALRTLPIVMLSARAGEEAGVEGLEAGADDYLVKPFSARELQARVRTHLELSRLRHEAEEQAHQARKMEAVGQLTGGIAHDFNNLLQAVLGSLELAERRVGADERVLHHLRNGMQAARRGARLTAQLLAFARRQRLEKCPTDLNRVISGMGDLLHRTLSGVVGVSLRLGQGLWPAIADANQIELAVLNLAINARDAMPEGGELAIETRNVAAAAENRPAVLQSGDHVLIEVRDTGVGMTPEVLARLFEPFFTTKGIGKGTGLGLAQVYGTVKQLGGEVTVDSRVGEGTRVCLYLPRAQEEAGYPEPPSSVWDGVEGGGGATILLVDDDPEARAACGAMLQELGHNVIAARNGIEALARIESGEGVDLVLTDHAMPGMTGIELAARIRSLRPDLGVLVATGYVETDTLAADAVIVLRKPFGVRDLQAVLAEALTSSPRPG
ncbi:ATP-binding protein [Arenibaculum pallidiluteum]|uniref:ATP-binding protein n=1 Tax=Arenibaculum pallidiluteum TaxID=2812559 RepID=UPI001A96089A|nr:ATP-binding protein [Arenibaculum pallidiluteum]